MKRVILIPGTVLLLSFGWVESDLRKQMEILSGCQSGHSSQEAFSYICVSQPSAERILGQSARLTESGRAKEDGVEKYRCSYQVTTGFDAASNLYYMLEFHRDATSAREAYVGILSANTRMPGQRKIEGIGDEAWLHSDNHNFHLIIFRKGHVMVRMKVNKVTKATSLDELKEVAREIALKL